MHWAANWLESPYSHPRTGPGDSIQSVAIGSICEEPERQNAPQATGSMDGNRADRIIDFQTPLDKNHRDDDQHSGDRANDHGRNAAHISAGGSDRDKACQQPFARMLGSGLP